ncbi:hypothetical protein FH609_028385 [Streptomyces sp. 3MP-14]|uniref:Uncharacterized protein n=1 Tax=Streptomyces mimosae TaxID=2586635 RepID=A0A5N5ZUP5_9ACTN|nr:MULTISPECIES: hypothetical protein [Streptomyces]KAB8160224.1 hypothetical protein FH607_026780 [Streptomyces mimosae]KAB8173014.1 hypothetical protein FH609_028385 [Streptomyces sp. 3MP-14]
METIPVEDRIWTPEDQQLPADLVEQVVRVLRRVGLPVAHENGDVGVFLTRGDGLPMNATEPADHVGLSWHVPHELFDAMEEESTDERGPATRLLNAVEDGMETTVAGVLTAAGLRVSPHPVTETLSVWAAPAR